MVEFDEVKSERINVSMPPGLMKEVRELAARMGTSDAAAFRTLVMEGLKAMQSPDNPFRKKD